MAWNFQIIPYKFLFYITVMFVSFLSVKLKSFEYVTVLEIYLLHANWLHTRKERTDNTDTIHNTETVKHRTQKKWGHIIVFFITIVVHNELHGLLSSVSPRASTCYHKKTHDHKCKNTMKVHQSIWQKCSVINGNGCVDKVNQTRLCTK